MKVRLSLNGKDIEAYNLVALDGTLNTLLKPAAPKKLITNENSAINGVMVVSTPSKRRVDKQDISLSFLIGSTSLIDLRRDIDTLTQVLIAGKNNSGVNELVLPELEQCYRLIYSSISSYANFGLDGKAKITIKFTEPNPANRAL